MLFGSHISFIAAAYTAATLILTATIVWVIFDYRSLKRVLSDLEARGVTRRSGSKP